MCEFVEPGVAGSDLFGWWKDQAVCMIGVGRATGCFDAVEVAEPVVEALVSVVVTEPDRVVSVAVDCALPVLVSLVLPVVVVPEAVPLAAVPVAVEEPEEVQETVLGRSVTPPREQMPLATWRVAAERRNDNGQQRFGLSGIIGIRTLLVSLGALVSHTAGDAAQE